MKVYELSRGTKYEGSYVISICGSLERAILGAWEEAESQKKIYPDDEWTLTSDKDYLFYITNTMDDYIFVKERELIE
jgi:hypothetical protein